MLGQHRKIESITLQYLSITHDSSCNYVIKCPDLKVLSVEHFKHNPPKTLFRRMIKWKHRSPCKPYDEIDNDFEYTCHLSELQKIGMEVKG